MTLAQYPFQDERESTQLGEMGDSVDTAVTGVAVLYALAPLAVAGALIYFLLKKR